MATFGAVTFAVRATTPGGLDRSDVTEVHIPGGAVNYVDIGGLLASHIEMLLYFSDEANYTSLRALVGTQATLDWHGGTEADTLLVSLSRSWRNSDGKTMANAVFIVP